MAATFADYDWFDQRPAGLSEAYCLTLVRGLRPAEFLARIGAEPAAECTGIDPVAELCWAQWDETDGRTQLIAVTTVPGPGGDWALGVEVNGYLGVSEELIVPLSAGTRVVSHYRNVNAVDRFYWVEDGDVRLSFEPLFCDSREGSTPDALLDDMRAAGLDLSGENEEIEHVTEATLALAERLTGVRLTPELLEDSRYTCGLATTPV